ncbi:uncharacterized protein PV06_08619 [Exophiala oligosperma]|uniref:Peptidase A1 domain-containing protein n=2 Tax=Chaetothyriales TaxID=34395 RepID=A0A0D2AIY0_9EURO|nr:uncharacterized protein PV06_08619 [Exophiala oligosperma]KAJ9641322.1 hypothetical protein H2204_003000 [Knufia peltigerae]KIW40066.1 hypothetical protein PV06_08619 [Exophiala oligosperma]
MCSNLLLFSLPIILSSVSAALNIPAVAELHTTRHSTNSTLRNFTAKLQANAYGTTFAVNVTLGGGQTFPLLVDTGSSDLWVVQNDWICVNDTSNAILPREDCGLGPEMYHPDSTFQEVPDEFYGEIMGNGRQSGILGKEDVTIGGATVKGQTIGVANVSSNPLDGTASGIFGLAYPVWTSAHPGSVLNQSNNTYDYDRVIYSPFFNSLYEEGQCEPYFSLALERIPLGDASGPGGYLTFGSLPPVRHSANFSVAPVQNTPLPVNITNNKAQPSWWSVNIDSVVYGPGDDSSDNLTTNSTQFLAVVDSGNWFNFLPNNLADLINSRFSPPAVLDPTSYPPTYKVACNASAPTLGFSIGNQTFFHDGRDLILDMGGDSCVSSLISFAGVSYEGVQLHGGIVGASFLKNVVAVFDFGKTEMRFAARTNSTGISGGNSSTSTTTTPSSTSSAPGNLLTWSTKGLMLMVAMVFAFTITGSV